jgi:Transglycosylase-like domain/Putative peptidoglycan binding domain
LERGSKTLPATVHAVRRPLLACVLTVLLLVLGAGSAWAGGGGATAPTAKPKVANKSKKAKGKGTSEAATVVLKRGDRGAAVRQLQQALGITADGVFGAQTEQALTRFQRRKGLDADGVVGPQTREALGLEPFARGSVRRSTGDAKLPRILRQIAECESGGNPRAVSSGGQYRGKYQFSLATWRNLGGEGDPVDAPEDEQDRLALKLYRRAGTSPWPSCP